MKSNYVVIVKNGEKDFESAQYLEIGGWKGCGKTASFYIYKKYT